MSKYVTRWNVGRRWSETRRQWIVRRQIESAMRTRTRRATRQQRKAVSR